MLSGRELAIERNAQAASWVNQRVIYTHGIGITMVPVNEVTPEGQPRCGSGTCRRCRRDGAPEIVQPRIYFGEGDPTTSSCAPSRPSSTTRATRARAPSTRRRRGPADTGVPLDSTLNRLLYALRFRDLDLLISDQVTADSQLLFHRTMADRLPRIAPFLRYDKDPYLVVDDRGHLVYVQDAYTISDQFPHATWFNSAELGAESGLAATSSTTSGTA